jgi:hypothetical protein
MIMLSITTEYILVIHYTFPADKDHGIIGITLIQYPSNDISQHQVVLGFWSGNAESHWSRDGRLVSSGGRRTSARPVSYFSQ